MVYLLELALLSCRTLCFSGDTPINEIFNFFGLCCWVIFPSDIVLTLLTDSCWVKSLEDLLVEAKDKWLVNDKICPGVLKPAMDVFCLTSRRRGVLEQKSLIWRSRSMSTLLRPKSVNLMWPIDKLELEIQNEIF